MLCSGGHALALQSRMTLHRLYAIGTHHFCRAGQPGSPEKNWYTARGWVPALSQSSMQCFLWIGLHPRKSLRKRGSHSWSLGRVLETYKSLKCQPQKQQKPLQNIREESTHWHIQETHHCLFTVCFYTSVTVWRLHELQTMLPMIILNWQKSSFLFTKEEHEACQG